MRPRVVVTQRIHRQVADILRAQADVTVNEGQPWSPAQLLKQARDADALMVFMPDSINDEFLAQCRRLKIISAALKGSDNFDVAACARRGIRFSIVPDLLTEATAELALALMLGLARNVLPGDRLIRSGQFAGWRPVLYGSTLHASTVGIVGFGQVGQALARLLEPFRCELAFNDREAGAPLEQLLRVSDVVVALLPLTGETLHLFQAGTLARMKGGAFLINVGRGSVVDEEAVADALESGHLAGYGADVFEMEDWARADRPTAISERLLKMTDRTLFTPHLGSAVRGVRLAIELAAAENILQVLNAKTQTDSSQTRQ